uniref:Phage tail lysozyme domain-containing protein n=1 Tax=Mycena chlorophos TaxID=658473 RepID=A0ABQ0KXQ2_MYCCL|nr:predicted protein [Mycena chlorophos]
MLAGDFEYNPSTVQRETLTGMDTVHGYSEKPVSGHISATLRDSDGLTVADLNAMVGVTVTAELANGKTIIGSNMWTVEDQTVKSTDATLEVKWEGPPFVLKAGDAQKEYSELNLREPTAGELEKASRAETSVGITIKMIAAVSGWPEAAVSKLCQRDFREASDFFANLSNDGDETPSDGDDSSLTWTGGAHNLDGSITVANNVFQIVISATDKATDTVRKVNQSLGKLTAPFENAGKSFKSLGRELGFEKINKNLSSIGATAKSAASSVGSIVAPMAALAGVGSVAGIAALADNWAKLGRGITYAAQDIGMGTGQLQEFQGAAKLAGLSSESMTQGLKSLGATMEDALYGRNQQALVLFDKLGVGIKRTKDGAMDTAGEFRALAASIAKIKSPQVQDLVAGQFGISQLLPLIRMGPAGMDKLMAKARELGLVMDGPALQSANDFALSLSSLEASGEGLKNTVGNAIIPGIKPLIDQLTVWVSKNRTLISQDVAGWAKAFGDWVQSINWKAVGNEISDLIGDIRQLVDWLGGWKRAAIGVAIVMNGSLIASIISLGLGLGKLGIGLGAIILKFTRMTTAAREATSATEAASAASSAAGAAAAAGAAEGAGAAAAGSAAAVLGRASIGGWLVRMFGSAARFAMPDTSDPKYQQMMQVHNKSDVDNFMHTWTSSGDKLPEQSSAQPIINAFQKMGWTRAQAAGIAANLARESAFNPSASGDWGQAYGIGQWHADRQEAFAKWAGHDIRNSSLDEQLGFVNYELTQGNEQRAGTALRGATNAQEAGAIISADYERPADAEGEAARRAGLAGAYASAPQGPYADAAPAVDSKVQVHVQISGAPPGTTAKVTNSSNAQATSRPASFRGVPFAMTAGSGRFGRRVAIHQYPKRDKPWPEDLGRSAREFQVTGFLVEDDVVYGGGSAIDQRESMVAAMETEGYGLLVHPTYGQLKVSVPDRAAEFTERWDLGRCIQFTVTFIEAGERVFPSTSQSSTSALSSLTGSLDVGASTDFVTSLTQTINLGLGTVAGVLSLGSSIVGQVVSTVARFTDLVTQAAQDATSLANMACLLSAATGQSYGRYVNAPVSSAFIASRTNSGTANTMQSLETQAAAYREAVSESVSSCSAAAAATDSSTVEALATAAQAMTQALSAAIINPADAIRLFGSLAAYSPSSPAGSGQTQAGRVVAQDAVSALLRRASITGMATAVATYTPTSYNDALDVRSTLLNAIDDEILIAGDAGDDNTYQALRGLRQGVVVALQQAGANLAKLRTFTLGASLPALVLANRLYQDASREDQLVAQVDPVHPAFMPATFSALSD